MDSVEGLGVTGLSFTELNEFNDQPVQLGELPRDPWLIEELERFLKEDVCQTFQSKFDFEVLCFF
jgi:hypothetical protein